MNQLLRVGIIGEFDPKVPSHIATNEALGHAANFLSVGLDCTWLPTRSLEEESSETILKQCDALWLGSGGTYESAAGAHWAVQFARRAGWPFFGT